LFRVRHGWVCVALVAVFLSEFDDPLKECEELIECFFSFGLAFLAVIQPFVFKLVSRRGGHLRRVCASGTNHMFVAHLAHCDDAGSPIQRPTRTVLGLRCLHGFYCCVWQHERRDDDRDRNQSATG